MREMEIMLGLKDEERIQLDDKSYRAQFETEKDKTTKGDKCPRDETKNPHSGSAGKCTWGEVRTGPHNSVVNCLRCNNKSRLEPLRKRIRFVD